MVVVVGISVGDCISITRYHSVTPDTKETFCDGNTKLRFLHSPMGTFGTYTQAGRSKQISYCPATTRFLSDV
jgi:hypothetical protein